jgi:hypothetical protein
MKTAVHIKFQRFLLIFGFILSNPIWQTIHAQGDIQQHIDSLHRIYSSAPDDSSRIRIFNFLSWYHDRQNTEHSIDSALFWVDKAIKMMAKPENITIYNYAYIQGAIVAGKNKDFPKETEYYLKYLDAAKSTNNKNWEGEALAGLCRLF